MPTGADLRRGNQEIVEVTSLPLQTNDVSPLLPSDSRSWAALGCDVMPCRSLPQAQVFEGQRFRGRRVPRPNGDKVVSVTDWVSLAFRPPAWIIHQRFRVPAR